MNESNNIDSGQRNLFDGEGIGKVAEDNTSHTNDRLKPITLKELAESHGLHLETIKKYRRQGVDVHDPEAVRNWHALNLARQPEKDHSGGDIADLRKAKLIAETELKQAQAEKARIEADLAAGKTVSLEEAKEAQIAIAAKVKAALKRQATELPPKLEGLTAKEMVGAFLAYYYDLQEQLKDSLLNDPES